MPLGGAFFKLAKEDVRVQFFSFVYCSCIVSQESCCRTTGIKRCFRPLRFFVQHLMEILGWSIDLLKATSPFHFASAL